MSQERVARAVREQALMIEAFLRFAQFEELTLRVVEALHQGGRLFLFGSAGLGSIANLVADRFLRRLDLDRPLLPAVSLCHDVTLALSLARDGQQCQFLSRQLRALAQRGDVALGFGEVQRDEAFEEALEVARELGCFTAVLLAEKAELMVEPPEILFRLGAENSARMAEGALFFGQLLCEAVEGELFGIG